MFSIVGIVKVTKPISNNLSDTLPFNFLGRERMAGRDVLFIDVDYPDLIRKKCDVILAELKPLHVKRSLALKRTQRQTPSCLEAKTIQLLGAIFETLSTTGRDTRTGRACKDCSRV